MDKVDKQSLYVGNLPFSATEEAVRELFERYGEVHEVRLITDRDTGRRRGFGFVDMDLGGARAAQAALDGNEFQGRMLRVNPAQERAGGRRGGKGGRGGGGGGRRAG
jgi:RNA recognition motif-containing protein